MLIGQLMDDELKRYLGFFGHFVVVSADNNYLARLFSIYFQCECHVSSGFGGVQNCTFTIQLATLKTFVWV